MAGENDAIALCLSGGGLRATLFHLGVVKALREDVVDGRSALSRVAEIYSVSGGSILALHMLLNWERYVGEQVPFAEVENELIAFAGRNVRDRILRRWILFRPRARRCIERCGSNGQARVDNSCVARLNGMLETSSMLRLSLIVFALFAAASTLVAASLSFICSGRCSAWSASWPSSRRA
jgi:Patatin-like phospholipase